ncbi:DUF1656 domain-containing protein [Methylocella sp.]|uniref:DUF1656 domain-containing protein n=1 Tax=Methylocella sp. TaxID=1978226 RepID=UPI003784FBC4
MTQEIDIYGVFVPSLLLWAACALALTALLRRLFALSGAHRRLWRPTLFDLGVFLALLGCLTLPQAA